jgi:hypothetical protein
LKEITVMKFIAVAFALALMASSLSELKAQGYSQPVREVEKPHKNPYQLSGSVSFGTDCTNCSTTTFTALPANKRFVVEHVSISVYGPSTGSFVCRIGPPGGPWTVIEPPRYSTGFLVVSQPIRQYLNVSPLLVCTRNEASASQWSGSVSLVGYLGDIQ